MNTIAIYMKRSTDIRENFVELDASIMLISEGTLSLHANSEVEKLQEFKKLPANPEDLWYDIPLEKIMDFSSIDETKSKPVGVPKLIAVQQLVEEEISASTPVLLALRQLQQQMKFGNRLLGVFTNVANTEGKKTIGTLVKLPRQRWEAYPGISTGTMEVVEKMYAKMNAHLV